MNKEKEICGDEKLSFYLSIKYILINLISNIFTGSSVPKSRKFYSERTNSTSPFASPGRALTTAFIEKKLLQFVSAGKISVLDVGCGSGALCNRLSSLGYFGDYVGCDINNNFSKMDVQSFNRKFYKMDIHKFNTRKIKYDLIISISALEHIPDDKKIISKFPSMLKNSGKEVHFVPTGWGLFIYLLHGYRQYTLRKIAEKFGIKDIIAIPLGGFFSFLLHFLFITVAEILLKINLRRKMPRTYEFLLDSSLSLDRFLPILPSMYVVIRDVK